MCVEERPMTDMCRIKEKIHILGKLAFGAIKHLETLPTSSEPVSYHLTCSGEAASRLGRNPPNECVDVLYKLFHRCIN